MKIFYLQVHFYAHTSKGKTGLGQNFHLGQYFWLDQGNHPVVDGDNNNRDSENKNNAKLVCAKQFQAADERK